jgi:hypothetical protein
MTGACGGWGSIKVWREAAQMAASRRPRFKSDYAGKGSRLMKRVTSRL